MFSPWSMVDVRVSYSNLLLTLRPQSLTATDTYDGSRPHVLTGYCALGLTATVHRGQPVAAIPTWGPKHYTQFWPFPTAIPDRVLGPLTPIHQLLGVSCFPSQGFMFSPCLLFLPLVVVDDWLIALCRSC